MIISYFHLILRNIDWEYGSTTKTSFPNRSSKYNLHHNHASCLFHLMSKEVIFFPSLSKSKGFLKIQKFVNRVFCASFLIFLRRWKKNISAKKWQNPPLVSTPAEHIYHARLKLRVPRKD